MREKRFTAEGDDSPLLWGLAKQRRSHTDDDLLHLPNLEDESVSKDPYGEFFSVDAPNLEFKKWEDRKMAYLRVRSFFPEKVQEDNPQLLEFYSAINAHDTLIIDIRGNGGGTDQYWRENIVSPLAKNELEAQFFYVSRQGKYVNRFSSHGKSAPKNTIPCVPPEVQTHEFIDPVQHEVHIEKSDTPFNGRVYLLIDWWVYSASESFASFAKESGFATLVGITTGGDGRTAMPVFFVLPNSKLVVRIASSMGINPDGSANEEAHTSPDIYFEESKWDNDEEIIDFLLEYLEGRK